MNAASASLSLDQWIQIANAVGTWVAGLGTLAAVIVSLWLALDSRRVRLKTRVGIYWLIPGDGTQRTEFVNFDVTNVAERPVTISSVGWVIGRGKARRFALQDVSQMLDDVPRRLDHGQKANFATELSRSAWLGYIADFVQESPIKTMRGTVTTSVGTIVEAELAPELVQRIQVVLDARAAAKP
ncbi:hypothetical protein [Variovorax sp. Root411]|uniref:hypothetical protein n=1 Tax=Variovorax sp. Root411 TaxID=1736530 RepID=UPI0006F8CDFA|nr:hypothetical protein [Variovorax sp. Root411]KQW57073.1 hypothetical protein ASC92_12475 [Variovorax sp. Root411]